MAERSTMMDQYRSIKSRYRDAVLFFRLGDFYEMFFEDAIEASAILDLTLTSRQGEPMCGIPYHAAKGYVARLLRAGKKIAICEQLTEPGAGKGIVERDVVEVVTPGTTLEEDFLERGANNYLVSACVADGRFCIAYLDLSTGEFRAHGQADDGGPASAELLRAELYRLSPRELLVQQSLLERQAIAQALGEMEGLIVNRLPDWSFNAGQAAEELRTRFRLASLKGLGFSGSDSGGQHRESPELAAAGALLRYVDDTAKAAAPQLSAPLPYREDEFVAIDEGSRKNLELVRNLGDSGRGYSLLSILDETKTAPGARLLRQWILQPLRDRQAAEARLEAVEFLYRDQRLLAALREALGGLRDIERLASRIAMDKAHARDLLALASSIRACAAARALIEEAGATGLLRPLGAGAEPEAALLEPTLACALLIESAIRDEPSILLTEGGIIKAGFDGELDRLQGIKSDSRQVLEQYIEEERAASGIANLRVRYNRIIGYYLEVSKGKLDSVPAHFLRRQSLVSGERYTTARLSELESEINGATERIVELERRLFLELREGIKVQVPAILALGRAAAVQDCIASFARVATARGYSRPRLVDGGSLRISQGRHPVVEAYLPSGSFVPNGLELDASPPAKREGNAAGDGAEACFALITGPNMAGKSTFLRQTALIVLMAQAGSFVPALDVEIGMVDKVFCRVGAQDNLARGESTFLVEMHETAFILNTATPASLVIMDEVGRGTSTLDGLAIAWAVSEHLLSTIRCRCLFATHYHELTAIEHKRMRNYSMAVAEEEGEVVFLKRIEARPAEGSYGIHVAKLAGIPAVVLDRARTMQAELARNERSLPAAARGGSLPPAWGDRKQQKQAVTQESLFSPGELVLAELASIDTDRLSPLEALNRLAALKKGLQSP